MKFIKCIPSYMERVWGGNLLRTEFGRNTPTDKVIGESWDISDNSASRTKITGGRFDGLTLGDAIIQAPCYIMGDTWNPYTPFPILVKWLDTNEKLSLQVHPNARTAKRFGGSSKVENWYFAECSDDSYAIAGLKSGVSKEVFMEAIKTGDVENIVEKLSVKSGDSVFIPTGLLHALEGENLVLEIQENSDTTYRVFDWNRVDLDGKPRELHVEESLACIDFSKATPRIINTDGKSEFLCKNKKFTVRKEIFKTGDHLKFDAAVQPRILSVVSGELVSECGGKVCASESVVLPFAESQNFVATSDTVALITENFAVKPPVRKLLKTDITLLK